MGRFQSMPRGPTVNGLAVRGLTTKTERTFTRWRRGESGDPLPVTPSAASIRTLSVQADPIEGPASPLAHSRTRCWTGEQGGRGRPFQKRGRETTMPDASRCTTLAMARAEQGLSVRQLAARAAVTPETVTRIERGITRTPRPHVVRRLSAALGIAPEQIGEFRASLRPVIARSALNLRPRRQPLLGRG